MRLVSVDASREMLRCTQLGSTKPKTAGVRCALVCGSQCRRTRSKRQQQTVDTLAA